MQKEILTTEVSYCMLTELAEDERRLVISAREATLQSHSPYSKYRVGTALLTDDGKVKNIVSGANQENASYGLTVCAERTTIFAANNRGFKRDIRKVAVTGRLASMDPSETRSGGSPTAPCGACRQVIKEAEDLGGEPIVILMDCYNNDRIARVVGIGSLLPLAFGPADFGMSVDD